MKIKFYACLKPLKPSHGPQEWPWWRLVVPHVVKIHYGQPVNTGKRLWLYSRWGAIHFDICFIGGQHENQPRDS